MTLIAPGWPYSG